MLAGILPTQGPGQVSDLSELQLSGLLKMGTEVLQWHSIGIAMRVI